MLREELDTPQDQFENKTVRFRRCVALGYIKTAPCLGFQKVIAVLVCETVSPAGSATTICSLWISS